MLKLLSCPKRAPLCALAIMSGMRGRGPRSLRTRRVLGTVAVLLQWAQLSSAQPQFSFGYVANVKTNGNEIHGFRVSETNGSVAVLDQAFGFPVQTGQSGNAFFNDRVLCLDSTNDRLFVLNVNSSSTNGSVSGYRINRSSGRLTELGWSPQSINLSMLDSDMPNRTHTLGSCAVHPTEMPHSLLMVAIFKTGFEPRNGFVASYRVTDTSITEATGSPFATGGPNPNSVRFSLDGSYLYAGGAVSGRDIAIYSVNSGTGVLTSAAGSPFNQSTRAPMRAYQVTPQGEFLAVGGLSNAAAAGSREAVLYYSSTSAGVPSFGASVATGLEFAATSLLHPSGFLIVADRGFSSNRNRVGVYRFSPVRGASVSAVPGSPFATGGGTVLSRAEGSNLLARSDNGDFVYVAHSNTRNMTRFSVNSTSGVLTKGPTQDINTIGSSGRPSGIGFVSQQVVCGDGTVDLGIVPTPQGGQEVCDDGNAVGGDGCSADCQLIEENFECPVAGEPCMRLPNVDVSVSKSDNLTSATPGGLLTYLIEVGNSGPDLAPDVRLTDVLPSELNCSYLSESSGSASGNTPAGDSDLDEELSLPPGSSVTYTLTCQIDSGATGTLSNTVSALTSLMDNDTENNSATDDDTVLVPSADLEVTKSADAEIKHPGESISYQVVVTNLGPSDALGSGFMDTVPADITGVTWTCSASTGSSCGSGGAGDVISDTMDLVAGGQATYQINGVIRSDFIGSLVNTASATTTAITDPESANDRGTVMTEVTSPADVVATKTVEGDLVPGGEATYTIVLRNRSAYSQFDDPDSDEFSDSIPEPLKLLFAAASSGSLSTNANGLWWNGSVPGSGEVTITVTASIRQSAADEAIVNQGLVHTDQDGDGINDTIRLTDDPAVAGTEDETLFVVSSIVAVPTIGRTGLLALFLVLFLTGRTLLRRL